MEFRLANPSSRFPAGGANRLAFNKEVKAGKRFYLALVDPLLKKPAYFAVKKPTVKVGFLRGCDWTLPWSAMGIDVIEDSRKFDATSEGNCCDLIGNRSEMMSPKMGYRDHEPEFSLRFTSGTWSVESHHRHGCCVKRHGTQQGISSIWGTNNNLMVGNDGLAFELWCPCASVAIRNLEYNFPAQKFRFVFVICKEGEYPPMHRLDNVPPTLLSLPVEVLAHIGSYLAPEEYFSTLALVGRVFTSPKLKKQIPWPSVTLDASFDSFRTVEMASPDSLRAVRCQAVWDKAGKAAFYAKWRPLIYHEHLTTLDLEDPSVLRQVGVPPNLQDLRLRMRAPRTDFWSALKDLVFPASVTHLAVRYEFPPVDFRDDAEARLDPAWLFDALPGLVDLHFYNVSFKDEEWDEFSSEECDEVLEERLAKIERLFLQPVSERFPLDRMPNLTFMEVGLGEDQSLSSYFEHDVEFRKLESFVVKSTVRSFDRDFGLEYLRAPNLRYLQVESDDAVSKGCLHMLPRLFPRLEFVRVDKCKASLLDLRGLLKSLPSLKHVEVGTTPDLPFQEISASSFPQHPNMFLRWTWTPSERRKRGKVISTAGFNFTFSRGTSAEYEDAQKAVLRGINLAA